MDLTNHSNAILKQSVDPHVLPKVYIEDAADSPDWVDFSTAEYKGTNRFVSSGKIKHTIEKDLGVLQTEVGSVILDNSDGFFSKPFPSDLKNASGNDSTWDLTVNKSRHVLYRHRIKLTFTVQTGEYRYEEYPLGVFLIDGIKFDHSRRTVTLKLTGLAMKLMKLDASNVKHGLSWYTNRPANFLVQELVKLGYQNSSGAIPAEYSFEDLVTIPTHDNSLAVSHYGRPPEWDGSAWRTTGKRTTAVVYGTISGTGNDDKLWLGIEDEVWRFDPTTDTYTLVDDSITDIGDEKICQMFIDSSVLYVVSANNVEVTNVSDMHLYKYTGNGSLVKVRDWWMWLGVFQYRQGGLDPVGGVKRFIGRMDWSTYAVDFDMGENVSVPFSQKITMLNSTPIFSRWQMEATAITDDNTGEFTTTEYSDPEYYYHDRHYFASYQYAGFGNPALENLEVRHSLGTHYCVCYSPYDVGYFLYFYANTDYEFALHKVNLSTEAATSTNFTALDDPREQPLCMAPDTSSTDYVYIATMKYVDNSTDDSECKMWNYRFSTDAFTNITWLSGATGNDVYWTVLEMIYFNSECVSVIYNRATMQYALYKGTIDSTWAGETDIIHKGVNQFKGLSIGGDGKLYCYEIGSGKVLQVDLSWNATYLAYGDSCVDNETNLSCGLTFDSSDSTTGFGVSAPGYNPDTQPDIPSGKYYLFKIADNVTDRIELADFDELSAWEAIKRICLAVHCVAGFDESGNFFMKSRDNTESATDDFTIGYSQTEGKPTPQHHQKLTEDSGESEMYNYAVITPYSVVKQKPSGELALVKRPEGTYADDREDIPFIDFVVDHRDDYRKTVKVVCIRGGMCDEGTSRWRFQAIDTTIETHLVSAASAAATTYYLASLFGGNSTSGELNDPAGIQIGDFAMITDPNGDEVIKRIDDTDPANITITTNTSLNPSDILPVKYDITVLKRFAVDGNDTYKSWSDEGVTYCTSVNGTAERVNVANVQQVSYGCYGYLDDSGGGGSTWEGWITDVNYEDGYVVCEDLSTEDNTNDILYLWFAPGYGGALDYYWEIGGTNVFVKFISPASGTEDDDWTKRFFEGDVLTVTCPGLELQTDEHAKQSAINITSSDKYGKLQYPTTDNRFVSRRMARHLAGLLVSNNKDPRPIITITTEFRPDISIINSLGNLSQVRVASPTAFPNRGRFSEPCTVRSIVHDLGRRTSTFILKSKTFQ